MSTLTEATAGGGRPTEGLLPLIAAGDETAFRRLYDRYSPTLYGVLLKILGSAEDAQEVLQEIFVRVWTRANTFDAARGTEIAWLISIARSRGIDRLRSRKIRGQRETDAGKEISNQGSSVGNEGAERIYVEQQQAAVRSVLSELPEAQRRALELAYFEGLSQSEIAAKLGEPLGTIKTRMQLGMKKLRERLRVFRQGNARGI